MALADLERAVLALPSREQMLAETSGWAEINSGSANLPGLERTAAALAASFARLPGLIEWHDGGPVESVAADGSVHQLRHGRHMVVRVRRDAPLRLLFTGHMDTVYGADHPFQRLTWLDDDRLNGPGVADMKGGLAVMLAALEAVETAGLADRFGYDVLINSDEEVGSPSSAPLIAELARDKAAAFTYEPAALPDGTLAGARAGSGNFAFVVSGRSAHAGRNPEDGRNAIVAAADLAVRLKALHRPGLSVNPARIDGGGPNNVVPDKAVLRVNMRPATPDDEAQAETAVGALCNEIAGSHDVRIDRHGAFARPPKLMDARAEALFAHVRACGSDLGLAIDWRASGGVCDGNNIAACGVPVVDTMGVRGGAIHSADEYLIVSSLVERAQLSALAVLRLVLNGGL